ncbi:MAG: hypothetical protein QOI66_2690 [Myxococcales bacterium]|nr:hypothetical protein [Myxococcales bacterium]
MFQGSRGNQRPKVRCPDRVLGVTTAAAISDSIRHSPVQKTRTRWNICSWEAHPRVAAPSEVSSEPDGGFLGGFLGGFFGTAQSQRQMRRRRGGRLKGQRVDIDRRAAPVDVSSFLRTNSRNFSVTSRELAPVNSHSRSVNPPSACAAIKASVVKYETAKRRWRPLTCARSRVAHPRVVGGRGLI